MLMSIVMNLLGVRKQLYIYSSVFENRYHETLAQNRCYEIMRKTIFIKYMFKQSH